MVQHALQPNKSNAAPHVVSPIRKIPARAASLAISNVTHPMKVVADGKMHAKCNEKLTFTINEPSVFPNTLDVKEEVSTFYEFRTIRKVKA